MPYYTWRGITLEGTDQYGKLFARSLEDLDKRLLKLEIGLIAARSSYVSALLTRVPKSLKNDLLKNMASLLNVHIQVHEAIGILINTVKQKYLKTILSDMLVLIEEGADLSTAISCYNDVFDHLTYCVILAGEQTGNIGNALEQLNNHYEVMRQFNKKIMSALLNPIITFIFFILIALCIFIWVIPQFELFFSISKEPLPIITKIILSVSTYIRSIKLIYLLAFISMLLFVYKVTKKNSIYYADKFLHVIPYANNLYIAIHRVKSLKTLGLLLSSQVHLLDALNIVKLSARSLFLKAQLQQVIDKLHDGMVASSAFKSTRLFNCHELYALLTVGETSADLAQCINQAGEIYQEQLYNYINRLSIFLQPALLIFLGVCIAGLILAVYMPLFTLSSVVT